MSSQGPNSASTVANDATVGVKAWSAPSQGVTADNFYATCTLGTGQTVGNYLKHTGFGFSLPSGATIDGIAVEYEGNSNTATKATWLAVLTVRGGAVGGNDNGTNADLPATDAQISFGGSSDLWGRTWAYSDINASSFGFVYSPGKNGSGSGTARIDNARATVYYTVGSTYTLTASVGSCSLSGQAASLKVGREVEGGAVAHVLTGQAAELRATRKLGAEAGAVALSGRDASLQRGGLVSVEAGAFTAEGQPATLRRTYTLAAESGICTTTGQDAGLARGRHVAANAAEFVFDGQASSLSRGRRITASAGAFVFVGQNAALQLASAYPRVVIRQHDQGRVLEQKDTGRVFAQSDQRRVFGSTDDDGRVYAVRDTGRVFQTRDN